MSRRAQVPPEQTMTLALVWGERLESGGGWVTERGRGAELLVGAKSTERRRCEAAFQRWHHLEGAHVRFVRGREVHALLACVFGHETEQALLASWEARRALTAGYHDMDAVWKAIEGLRCTVRHTGRKAQTVPLIEALRLMADAYREGGEK